MRVIVSTFQFYFCFEYDMLFVSGTFLRKYGKDRDSDNKFGCLPEYDVEATIRSQSEK